MKTIAFSKRSNQPLHIEAPGVIINIRLVTDTKGRAVTSIEILADGNRYSGDPEWWIDDEYGKANLSVRVVETALPK